MPKLSREDFCSIFEALCQAGLCKGQKGGDGYIAEGVPCDKNVLRITKSTRNGGKDS